MNTRNDFYKIFCLMHFSTSKLAGGGGGAILDRKKASVVVLVGIFGVTPTDSKYGFMSLSKIAGLVKITCHESLHSSHVC